MNETQHLNRLILRLDALFLLLAGSVQFVLKIAGHFFRVGLYAQQFGQSAYTIGFFEAHGLAVLIALLLLADIPERSLFWHGRMVAVHLLLGGANLLFWQSFVAFDFAPKSVIAIILHIVFVLANSYCLLKANSQRSYQP